MKLKQFFFILFVAVCVNQAFSIPSMWSDSEENRTVEIEELTLINQTIDENQHKREEEFIKNLQWCKSNRLLESTDSVEVLNHDENSTENENEDEGFVVLPELDGLDEENLSMPPQLCKLKLKRKVAKKSSEEDKKVIDNNENSAERNEEVDEEEELIKIFQSIKKLLDKRSERCDRNPRILLDQFY